MLLLCLGDSVATSLPQRGDISETTRHDSIDVDDQVAGREHVAQEATRVLLVHAVAVGAEGVVRRIAVARPQLERRGATHDATRTQSLAWIVALYGVVREREREGEAIASKACGEYHDCE